MMLFISLPPGLAAADLILVPGDVGNLDAAIAMVSDGGVIRMAAGAYAVPAGGHLVGNLGKSFSVRAADGATVILDGGGVNPVFHLLNTAVGSTGPIVFQGLTFRNGLAVTDGKGGGVTLSRAEATFVDCVFENNGSDAPTTGGGGVAVFTYSIAFFYRCVFVGNWATNEGAGLRVGGESTAFVHECEFYDNKVDLPGHRDTAAGGGIHVGDSDLQITNSRIEGNRAGYVGGGLYGIAHWSDPIETPHADLVVANCTFVDNEAERDPSVTFSRPTEGGAVHAENHTTIRIFSSRFIENRAHNGGGVNLYRAIVTIHDSVFKGNQATAKIVNRGFGGAVAAISNDTVADGSLNRRSAQLEIRDSFIQGRFGSVISNGQIGGGVFSTGDQNRRYGLNSVTPTASASATRANVTLNNVAFADCDVDVTPGQANTGVGGAFEIDLTDLTMQNVIVIDSDAIGSTSIGGAGRVVLESLATIEDSTFAANSAEQFGGALYLQGSNTNLSRDIFIHNVFSPGFAELVNQSYGAAIFSGPIISGNGDFPVTGVVESCVFAANHGLPTFDGDRSPAPINDLRYNENQFHSTTFGDDVYIDALVGSKTVGELNALVVNRGGGVSTDKSQTDNDSLATEPTTATLAAVPPMIVPGTAAGDSNGSTESFLVWAWSGNSATLNTQSLAQHTGFGQASAGTHNLTVDGMLVAAPVTQVPAPSAMFSADPIAIASGQTSTLSWNLTSGNFVDAQMDRGVRISPSAAGSINVSPTVTTNYRLFIATEEGGVLAETTVWVDEPSVGLVFADGVESGDTSAWSSSVGSTQ